MSLYPDISGKVDGMGFPSATNLSTATASIIFLLATSVQLGMETVIVGLNISNYLGSSLFSIGSLSVTTATIVSYAAIAAVYAFNNNKLRDFSDHQSYMAYAVVFAVSLLSLSPPIRNAVSGSATASYLVTAFLTLGFMSIAEFGGGYHEE